LKLETSISKIDLSAIAAEHPVNQQTAVLNLNTFDATQLTLLEVLDMSDTVGVDPQELASLLKLKTSARKMRLLYAMAWVIARRANLELTFDEVCTWRLEVIGEVNEASAERVAKRAVAVVGVADMTGLPPAEAGKLTVAEINAYSARRKRANRAARRRTG
jgi:hypothetical protein